MNIYIYISILGAEIKYIEERKEIVKVYFIEVEVIKKIE